MNNEKVHLITCFICGKDLKQNIIKEHIDQCLPSTQRLPSDYADLFRKLYDGIEISEEEINQFNVKANKLFKEVSLMPCPNCGRKFYPDRVEVHIKSCKGNLKNKNAINANKPLNINNDSQRLFLEKLEKELQNEEKDSVNLNINPSPSCSLSNPMSMSMSHASTERNANKLRGSVNNSRKKEKEGSIGVGDESKKIFLEKLEKELQTQDNQQTNTKMTATIKKKKEDSNENSNKLFLEKLNKELKNEHEPEIAEIESMKVTKNATVNKPLKLNAARSNNLYENKKTKYAPKTAKEIDSNQKFMELLDKELSKESEMNSKVVEPKTTKEIIDDSNKLFLEKLEKEIQKDSGLIQSSENNTVNQIEEKPQIAPVKKDKRKEKDKDTTAQSSKKTFTKSSSSQGKKNQSAQYLAQHPSAKKSQLKVSNILCYICGKDYGSSSLPIHLKSCEVNWKKEHPNIDLNAEKPKILDDLLTQLKEQTLTQLTIDSYIKQAEKAYRILNYFQCPNCGQKFLTERLNVHLKGCHAQAMSSTKLFEEKLAKQLESNMNENSISVNPPSTNDSMPQAASLVLLCYICSQEFDKKALETHLESCMKQHSDIQTVLPRELEKIFAKIENEEEDQITNEEITIYNDIAKEQLQLNSMKNCPNCKQTVICGKLDSHLKICNSVSVKPIEEIATESEDSKQLFEEKVVNDNSELKEEQKETDEIETEIESNKETNNNQTDDGLISCYKCGRKCLAERIEVHMRICKG